ncbi:MAG TPA: FAD:protein FMN transferase, partial [Vicinamibacteria bacterium]
MPRTLAAVALAPSLLFSPLASASTVRQVRLVMGTTAEVEASGNACSETALIAAFAALGSVDERMSLWRDSELSRLNDAGEALLSEETLVVLRHALDVARASGGAFDPTVEPLVRAAGGLGDPPRALSDAERAALLARVGHARVRLDGAARRVTLAGGARLVLDGLAKGYAADRALSALRSAGALTGLVNLGESSLGVFGEPLTLELRDPRGEGLPWGAFEVEDSSVSTSGGDQKPGHIFDPRTG